MTLRLLVADCEPADARAKRREASGETAGESFAAVLHELCAGSIVDLCTPADAGAAALTGAELATYDGVVLTGSPIHVHDMEAAARREVAFMQAVFRSNTPSFGSCAGLQVAVTAAGGTTRPMQRGRESGIARDIWLTPEGADHPLMRGRPRAFAATTMHSDEVDQLPAGATLLAGSVMTTVQAVEIRHDGGIFWGVQYHPELSLAQIARALRRDAQAIIEDGFASDPDQVEAQAARLDALHDDPQRLDLRWQLGIDEQVTDATYRRRELRNFIDALVVPTAATRR